jgi:hypothetical protein
MIKLNLPGLQKRRLNDLEKKQMPGAERTQFYTEDFVPGPIINEGRYKCTVNIHIALPCDLAVTFRFHRDLSELSFSARHTDVTGDEKPAYGWKREAVCYLVHIETGLDIPSKRPSDFAHGAGGGDDRVGVAFSVLCLGKHLGFISELRGSGKEAATEIRNLGWITWKTKFPSLSVLS